MRPLRRLAALLVSVLVLQLTLAGSGVPCSSGSSDTAGAAMSGMGASHAAVTRDASCGRCDASTACEPSGAGTTSGDCHAVASCAPAATGVVAAAVRLAVGDAAPHSAAPAGRLLGALTRPTAPESPPPRD